MCWIFRDALGLLETLDERAAQVVSLFKFLEGCTTAEVAERLEISESTVESDWRFAGLATQPTQGETLDDSRTLASCSCRV